MSNTNTSAPTTAPASPLVGKSSSPAGDLYDKDYVEKQRQQYAQQQQQQQWQPASPGGTRQTQQEEEAAAAAAYGCCIANYGVSGECGCCGGDKGNTFPIPCCPAYSCCTPYSQHIAFRVILFLLSLFSVIVLGLSLVFYFVEVSGVVRETRTTTDTAGVSTTTVTYPSFSKTIAFLEFGDDYSYLLYTREGFLHDPFATEAVMVCTAIACQFVAFCFFTALLGFRVTAERQIQSDTRYAAALGPAEVTRRARRRVSADQALAWCVNVFLLLTFGLLVATMTRAASGAAAQQVTNDYTFYRDDVWGGGSLYIRREKFGRNAVELREAFYIYLGVACGVVCMLLILHSSTLSGADLFASASEPPSKRNEVVEEQKEAEAVHA